MADRIQGGFDVLLRELKAATGKRPSRLSYREKDALYHEFLSRGDEHVAACGARVVEYHDRWARQITEVLGI